MSKKNNSQYIFTENFTDLDLPAHNFVLAVGKDQEKYSIFHYIFYRYINKQYDVLLMKDFNNEDSFIHEINKICSIFEVSLFSDTYDLSKFTLLRD